MWVPLPAVQHIEQSFILLPRGKSEATEGIGKDSPRPVTFTCRPGERAWHHAEESGSAASSAAHACALFFLITLDPQMFGMPVRRPRVYMLGVRWDARAMATSTAMTELLQCMLAAITRSVTARATDFLLPSTHSLVRQSLEKSQQARRQAKSTGRRWLHRHAVARAAVQRHAPVRRLVPAPSVPGSLRMCSQREQDAWRLATERWGNRDFAVDLSQNADRVRGSVDGTCPTVTPGGQLFFQSLGRKITATEKLLLQAFPLHKMKKPQTISEHSLSKLAGNSMNLHCIGAALLLGMGLLDLTAASSAVAGQESRGPGLVLVCAPPKGGL